MNTDSSAPDPSKPQKQPTYSTEILVEIEGFEAENDVFGEEVWGGGDGVVEGSWAGN